MSDFTAIRTFRQLYNGEIDHLSIAVCVGATGATRTDIRSAIWRLTREQFDAIVSDMVARGNFRSIEQAIEACDETGIENRFFRLNPAVALWIDVTDPVSPLDFVVL